MKKLTFILCLVLTLSLLYSKTGLKQKYVVEGGLSVPESVNFDTARNRCYVSNINGNPAQENGQGYISIIDTSGEMVEEKWVEGLNAPKGAAIYKNYLYVSDINRVVKIDINKAKITETYSVPEAKFLNDVAADKNGNVYISDSRSSAIYRLSDGEIEKWFGKDSVDGPNGLYIENDYLYLGNSGDGWIKKVKLGGQDIKKVAQVGSMIDGLIKINDNSFIVSDWKGKTQLIQADKKHTLLNTTNKDINSADLEYIKCNNLLFIPTFSDDRVMIYKLKGLD